MVRAEVNEDELEDLVPVSLNDTNQKLIENMLKFVDSVIYDKSYVRVVK